jgi:RNA polymerase sigma-70 factor (ECF subfamily)
LRQTTPTDAEEQELLRQLRTGTRASFERLMDRYERRIYNLALRMLADATEAEDATQDVFVEVHRALPKFRGHSRLDTWIHRIAVNVCLQRRRKRTLPTVELLEIDSNGDGADEPLREVMRDELRGRVESALLELPDIQRDVVLLHGMQGLTYAEVAAVLECPVGTVKSRLSSGFRRLRNLLAEYVHADAPASVETTR